MAELLSSVQQLSWPRILSLVGNASQLNPVLLEHSLTERDGGNPKLVERDHGAESG
jgi:hypothetical protein